MGDERVMQWENIWLLLWMHDNYNYGQDGNIIIFMNPLRKYLYIGIIGGLTCTTISATYWQTTRYLQARKRWDTISKELSLNTPPDIASISPSQLYPFRYLSINGVLSEKYMLISRPREGRMGFLIVRPLTYQTQTGVKCILAVQGWIPQNYVHQYKETESQFKGILREKQKKDYIHTKMKQADLQKFKMNTYIDVEAVKKELHLEGLEVQEEYYFEILKEMDGDQQHYPYQYSVDNFQLPYLTPDKHRAYATFWGSTTLVGLMAIGKVLRMG